MERLAGFINAALGLSDERLNVLRLSLRNSVVFDVGMGINLHRYNVYTIRILLQVVQILQF